MSEESPKYSSLIFNLTVFAITFMLIIIAVLIGVISIGYVEYKKHMEHVHSVTVTNLISNTNSYQIDIYGTNAVIHTNK